MSSVFDEAATRRLQETYPDLRARIWLEVRGRRVTPRRIVPVWEPGEVRWEAEEIEAAWEDEMHCIGDAPPAVGWFTWNPPLRCGLGDVRVSMLHLGRFLVVTGTADGEEGDRPKR